MAPRPSSAAKCVISSGRPMGGSARPGCPPRRCICARDAWMGWSDAQRKTHLHRVVCLSRFLIRPAVRCRHLASHVLGRVLRRVGADFEARYHYRPWLVETFVEPEHQGVSFKAANFVCVGHSAGRGRCDRDHARARTVKSVYMYELEAHWRRQLGVVRVEGAPSLAPGEGLDRALLRTWRRCEVVGRDEGRLMTLRRPDGPVAMPWPRSERTARRQRHARRSSPRPRCDPGGRTPEPGPCATPASPRSP